MHGISEPYIKVIRLWLDQVKIIVVLSGIRTHNLWVMNPKRFQLERNGCKEHFEMLFS